MAEKVEILRIEVDQKTAKEEVVKLEQQLVRLRKEQAAYKKVLNESNGTNKEAARQLVAVTEKIKDSSERQRELTKVTKTETGSLQALRNELARLTKERNNVNTTSDIGKKKFNELNAQIKAHSDSIKKAEEAGGDFRRSVGNYGRALENVGGPIGAIRDKIKGVGEMMGKAGPIGLAIGAVVGIVKLAISDISKFFESWEGQLSESGRKLEAFKLAVKTMWQGMAEERGKALAEGGVGGFFSKFFEQFGQLISMNPATFAAGITKLAHEFGATETAAREVVDAQIAWKQAILDSHVPLATVRKEMEDAENIMANKSGLETMEARELAYQKFLDLLDRENEIEDDITKKQLAFLELSGALTKNKFEELDAIQKLKAEQIDSDMQDADARSNAEARMKDINKLEAERIELIKLRQEQEANINNKIKGIGGDVDELGFAPLKTQEELNAELVAGTARKNTQIEELNKKSADRQVEIDKAMNLKKLDAMAGIADMASTLFEKQTVAHKILASATVGMDTAMAIMKALATVPVPLDIPYSIMLGGIGAAQIAKIAGIQFAEGGRIGNRGVKLRPDKRGDNRLIIAKDDEVILNAKHQAHIGADQLKMAGVPGYADGGFIGSKAGQTIMREVSRSNNITQTLKNMPAPELSIVEFTKVQNRIRVKEKISGIRG
jgi:hypothetical protein